MVPPRGARDAVGNGGLPALLRKFRTQAGLSQQALAERALISAQAVSALERGFRRAPYRATLERIADALGLSEEARQTLERSAPRSRGPRRDERDRASLQNLPRQLTSFLGRDAVVKEILELIAAAPLVSIVGTGGAGKTRTAVEVGRRVLHDFRTALVRGARAAARSRPRAARAGGSARRSRVAPAFSARDAGRISGAEALADRSGQLRTRHCARARPSRIAAARLSGRRFARYEPRGAGHRGRTSVSDPPALRSGAAQAPADRGGKIRRRCPVRGSRASRGSRFDLTTENVKAVVESAGASTACRGAGTSGGTRARALPSGDLRPARSSLRPAHRRASSVGSAPSNDARRDRLELRAPLLARAAALRTTRHLRRGVYPRDCDRRVQRRGNPRARRLRTSFLADRAIARDGRVRPRQRALSSPGNHAAVRVGKLSGRGEGEALSTRHALTLLRVAARLDREWYDASERAWFRDAEAEVDNFRAALDWSLEMRNDLRTGSFLAAALARLWYSLSPVEGRRWVRLAIDSINTKTRVDELAQLHIADAELPAPSANPPPRSHRPTGATA